MRLGCAQGLFPCAVSDGTKPLILQGGLSLEQVVSRVRMGSEWVFWKWGLTVINYTATCDARCLGHDKSMAFGEKAANVARFFNAERQTVVKAADRRYER